MTQGWKVDVAGAQDVVSGTARAGEQVQSAASQFVTALGEVVQSLNCTTAAGAAAAFARDHQDEGSKAVSAVSKALTAAGGAMRAFAEGDDKMAAETSAAAAGGPEARRG